MDIRVVTGVPQDAPADALVLGHYENGTLSPEGDSLNTATGGLLRDVLDTGDFTGKAGQVAVLYPRGSIAARRVILVGLGKTEGLTTDGLRRASALAAQRARDLKAKLVRVALFGAAELGTSGAAGALGEGARLGLYVYHGQKTSEPPADLPETLEIVVPEAAEAEAALAVENGTRVAEGARLARTLANLPPNVCTPAYLAEIAQKMADASDLRVEVLYPSQMESLKMGALLAVAQGSQNEPRFIVLEHNYERTDLPTVVLVGKGITFDTGGYSIKTAEGMVGMKGDMSGAAAVLGAMQAISALKVPLHVVGLVPTCDNMISEKAYVPQDVITASNGVTIEIISTDAEGRLILADALVYAGRFKPAAVVDIATLTGSMAVALGNAAAGVFSTDDTLRDRLVAAGAATGEKVWPMPLFAEYEKTIESKTADIKNSGGRFGGGPIGAVFLKRFTSYPAWAHIDMAGVMQDLPENPTVPGGGMSGYGARLLTALVRDWK